MIQIWSRIFTHLDEIDLNKWDFNQHVLKSSQFNQKLIKNSQNISKWSKKIKNLIDFDIFDLLINIFNVLFNLSIDFSIEYFQNQSNLKQKRSQKIKNQLIFLNWFWHCPLIGIKYWPWISNWMEYKWRTGHQILNRTVRFDLTTQIA